MNQLGFQWRTFESEAGSYDFLDYLIDDMPLPTWLGYVTGEPERWSVGSSVSPFWRGVNHKRATDLYRMFRGRCPGDVTADRIPIYVCSHCGDYSCGVASVVLEIKAETVRWLDYAEPNEDLLIANIPTLEFDRVDYTRAMATLKALD